MNNLTLELNIPKFIEPAFYNDKKYTCIPAGRRTGKTFNAVNWICEMLLCEGNEKSGLWVDTTQRNLTEYVDIYFRKILKPIWHLIRYDKQGHKLEFPNGSFLHLRSAERPENMEGFEYDYVVCNEAGIIFKRSELWTKTLMPMCKNAVVKIVGTPKGPNYYSDLANNASRNEDWATYTFKADDSPYWTESQLLAIKTDPSCPPDVWEQEYEAKFITTTSNVIVKRSHKASWRDDSDIPYTINDTWIRQQLTEGFYFACFDGGMHTTHSAGLLGYHNKRYRRDILLKEFFNINKNDNLREIAMQVNEFCFEHNLNTSELKLFGDPAIKTYGDEVFIEQVLNKKVNLLDDFKGSDDSDKRAIFANRKTKRLTVLNTEIFSLRSDNKPAIIVLKETDKTNPHSFGCPNIWQGIFAGKYRYEIKDVRGRSIITEDIEQIPPITDICDAYTYYLLADRPKPIADNDKINNNYRILG